MLLEPPRSPSEILLAELVAIPTISRRSNIQLIGLIEDLLAHHGVRSERIASADGTRANLHAIIGPADKPGVLLSGHTDVVPVEGQEWQTDPFQLVGREGRWYGRGAADMKGFLACVLAAVPKMVAADLAQPIHLAFSYDEEIGCVGVRPMIERLSGLEVPPLMGIVGEPTGMRVATAHKGKLAANCVCHGRAAHSALSAHGLNAIYLASDMIGVVRRLQDRLRISDQRDEAYSVPYTTLHVGTFAGGTALNIVPASASFEFEIRNLPADDPYEILDELQIAASSIADSYRAHFPEATIEIDVTNAYPALETSPRDEAVVLMQRLAGVDEVTKVAFGTEAGLFQQAMGIPVVICGPGSMDQGHKPDEFIEATQLRDCDRFLAGLIDELVVADR